MGKRGPQPVHNEHLSIQVGQSIDIRWQAEADGLNLPKAVIGRIAVDSFFAVPDLYIVTSTQLGDEKLARATLNLTKEQMEMISNRAAELGSSLAKIGAMAIAYRYSEAEFRPVTLLVPD